MRKLALILLLLAAPLYAGEPEDKDLTILRLQKIIAEQSLVELLRDERVKDYERIRQNHQRLLSEIAQKEKAAPKEKTAKEKEPVRDWGEP